MKGQTMDKGKKDKRVSNDMQNAKQKAIDWATKTGEELGWSGRGIF